MAQHSKKPTGWTVCIGLFFFAAGALLIPRLTRIRSAMADSERIFELRIYHATPGKLPIMESRFRDVTSKLLAKHNLNVVGFWTRDAADSDSVFVFLLAHQSQEEAKKNWEAMRIDPEFQQLMKSEQSEKTLEKADIIFLRPTDFSPTK